MNKSELEKFNLRTVEVPVELNTNLTKHLQPHEEICEKCKGIGLIVRGNNYGLHRASGFPFKQESLITCPECYNGVRKRCEDCNELIVKTRTKCHCNIVKDHYDKLESDWDTSEKTKLDEAINLFEMLYVANFEEFVLSDEFEYWLQVKKEITNDFPTKLLVFGTNSVSISLDVDSIIENGLEELHKDISIPQSEIDILSDFIDEWCRKQTKHTQTFYPDFEKGIII